MNTSNSAATFATDLLRNSTHSYHSVLDQLPLMKSLMLPSVTLEQYGQVIQHLEKSFREIEANFTDETFLKEWRYEKKADLLAQDLRILKIPQLTATTRSEFHSPEKQIGAMYVLLGSSLGGRFIAKHIASALRLTEESGLGFYHSSHLVQSQWVGFKENLNSSCEKLSPELEEIVSGASSAFKIFIQSFEAIN